MPVALLAVLSAGAVCAAPALAATPAPTLTSPVAHGSYKSPLKLEYTLPVAAHAKSLGVTFIKGLTPAAQLTLTAASGTAGKHVVSLSLAALSSTPDVESSSASALEDGEYTVLLSYQDEALDPAASVEAKHVTVDTVTDPPTLGAPAAEAVLEGPFEVTYTLPEKALAGSVQLEFTPEGGEAKAITLANTAAGEHTITIDPSEPTIETGVLSGEPLKAGRYQLAVSYQDATGNPRAGSTAIALRVIEAPLCEAGNYSETGEEPCTEASPGYYVETAGATAEIPCEPGTYDELSGSITFEECIPDEPGHYSEPGAAGQTPCAAGTYQPAARSFSCLATEPGHYSESGATAQLPCSIGTFQPEGEEGSCKLADPGHFVSTPAAIAEQACEAGTYAAVHGSSSCLPTPPGSYTGEGASSPTPCPAGTTNPSSSSKSASACEPDPPGYTSAPGSAADTPCSAGSFAAAPGSPACTPASPGSYVESPAATGSTPCPPGSYSSVSGATSCTTTPAGTYARGGAAAPIPCPAGSASAAGAASCTASPSSGSQSPGSPAGAGSGTPGPTGGSGGGQGAPTLTATAAAHQLSLRRRHGQLIRLTCSATTSVTVSATAAVSAGRTHLTLTASSVAVSCVAGVPASVTLSFKLGARALHVLAAGRPRLTLTLHLKSAGASAPGAQVTLRGAA